MSSIAQRGGLIPRPRQESDPRPTAEQRFWDFHQANPDVYHLLVESARAYRRQTGNPTCGISLLMGRVRWVLAIQTNSGDFKINNDYSPFYARLIMKQEPDLDGMFRTRRSVADGSVTA